MKDWIGNANSIHKTLGASNHSSEEREANDYYATEPKATELLCSLENFHHTILEPSCGEGHISRVLKEHGYAVMSSDLIYRGYGEMVQDFLTMPALSHDTDIVTNPPYSLAQEFVEHALEIIPDGCKVAMFLKLTFLEGQKRRELFDKTPRAGYGSVHQGFYAPRMGTLRSITKAPQHTAGLYGRREITTKQS